MKVGRFRDQITLKTNHKKMSVLSANLYGEVIGNIAVIPNYLSFGMIKRGEEYEKSIILKSTPYEIFRVLDVKTTAPYIKTKVLTIKKDSEYMVYVSTGKNFKGDYLNEKVLITTDEPDQAEIEVKIFGRVFP